MGNGLHTEENEREAMELLIYRIDAGFVVHSKVLLDGELLQYVQRVPGLVLINHYIPAL